MTDEQPLVPTLNFTKSDEYKVFYANWVQSSFTPFDISLVVGQAIAAHEGAFDVEQKARIIFHPAEAKIVATMLAESVRNYEEQFGEVSVDRVRKNVSDKGAAEAD